MSYYKLLGLEKEPFSTSPDPALFYLSRGHKAALYRLGSAVKLRRGLSIVIGDIGTGKTTLSRKLFYMLSEEKDISFSMILNPVYATEEEFLRDLLKIFKIEERVQTQSVKGYLEVIEHYLLKRGVEEDKTIVLLIDEAQKLSLESLEILRTLLNYETDEYKILQVILVGQMEILPTLKEMKNFWNRISLKCIVAPLDEDETKNLIDFRLKEAGAKNGLNSFFQEDAVKEIFEFAHGYPRRINLMCHDALEQLVINNKSIVVREMIREMIDQELAIESLGSQL